MLSKSNDSGGYFLWLLSLGFTGCQDSGEKRKPRIMVPLRLPVFYGGMEISTEFWAESATELVCTSHKNALEESSKASGMAIDQSSIKL